jgi:hypothetical protein
LKLLAESLDARSDLLAGAEVGWGFLTEPDTLGRSIERIAMRSKRVKLF